MHGPVGLSTIVLGIFQGKREKDIHHNEAEDKRPEAVFHRVVVLFSCKAYILLFELIKEGSVAAGDRAYVERCNINTLSTSLPSTSTDGRSTAGVADSKYIRVLILIKC